MADTPDTPKVPEMVERVARCIGYSLGYLCLDPAFADEPMDVWSPAWDWVSHARRSECVAIAKTIWRAIRAPTEAMIDAAPSWDCEECDGTGYSTNKAAWQAMTDAALGE